ncbi:MAG: hypothetical protein ACRCYU_15595 [Nocardioides sp.]
MRTNPPSYVRLACVIAGCLWVGLHVFLGVLYREAAADKDRMYWSAMALLVASSLVAMAPLLSQRPVWDSTPVIWALTAAVPIVQAANATALQPGSLTGYANWAAGGLGVILASLAFRGHLPLALFAAAGLTASQTYVYFLRPGSDGFLVAKAALLAVPPQVWIAGSWAMRRAIRRSLAAAHSLDARALDGHIPESEHDVRFLELVAEVMPLLRRASKPTLEPDDRETAAMLATQLRDTLAARALMTSETMTSIRRARSHGIRVTVASRGLDEATAAALRDALTACLRLPDLHAVTLRASSTDETVAFYVRCADSKAVDQWWRTFRPHQDSALVTLDQNEWLAIWAPNGSTG